MKSKKEIKAKIERLKEDHKEIKENYSPYKQGSEVHITLAEIQHRIYMLEWVLEG